MSGKDELAAATRVARTRLALIDQLKAEKRTAVADARYWKSEADRLRAELDAVQGDADMWQAVTNMYKRIPPPNRLHNQK